MNLARQRGELSEESRGQCRGDHDWRRDAHFLRAMTRAALDTVNGMLVAEAPLGQSTTERVRPWAVEPPHLRELENR